MIDTRNAHVAEPFRSTLNAFEDETARIAREVAAAGREARLDVQGYMNSALLFRRYPDALDFLFGPPDHDAHVQRYRNELWFAEKEAAHQRANAAVAGEVDRIIAGWQS